MCIAGTDQTLLAAQLSSYFNEPGTYFAMFEFPDADRPCEEVPQKDGYFAQILGKRAATAINNCLAYIQPASIILLGLSTAAQSYLRAILPEQKLLTINSEVELLALPFATGAPKPLKCKPSQSIQGLIAAKLAKKPLAFADDAPSMPTRQLHGKKGLIVVENPAEVGEVTIVNYATSIDADIVLVDRVGRDEILSVPRQLQAWANDRSSPALRDTRRKIIDRIRGIDFKKYEFTTFFTTGLPYGLILQNVIPFTHMLNGPYCAVSITNAIIDENEPLPTGSALLFSLDDFAEDETDDVAKRLDQNSFVITALVGRGATNNNLNNFGSHLPYDVLHICSHGGETDGYFVKQSFTDRDGKEHTVEYFEVVSFAPSDDPDMVKVERKMIFSTLDGIAWTQRPLAIYPRYVGDDMMQALRDEDDGLKRTPVNIPIALSCHIRCYQSFHQGAFDHLAAYAHPIIFNNSCSSSHELAAGFLAGGARCYLATLWNVGGTTAKKAALAFYDSALATGKVLPAFSTMLRSITNAQYRDIYIFWGLHFTSLVRPAEKTDRNIIAGLAATYRIWMRKLATSKDLEVKRNSLPIVRFIMSEIMRRLPPERLKQMTADLPDEQEIERSQAVDEPLIDELVVTKERRREDTPA